MNGLHLFWFALTVGAFLGADFLYRKLSRPSWAHPTILTPIAMVFVLDIAGVSTRLYQTATAPLASLLELSVIALALPLVRNMGAIRGDYKAVGISIAAGSVAGAASAVMFVVMLQGADGALMATFAVKSITTPVALSIMPGLDGDGSLAAMIIILSGVVCAVSGPTLLHRIGVDDELGVGIALGTAGHGVATAEAIRRSDLMGAASGFAMAANGLATAIILPLIWPYFG